MKTEKAYYVGIHPACFRVGEPAEIIGVKINTPENYSERVCFHLIYSDLVEDYVPVEDTETYKIISFKDILEGNIPEVL